VSLLHASIGNEAGRVERKKRTVFTEHHAELRRLKQSCSACVKCAILSLSQRFTRVAESQSATVDLEKEDNHPEKNNKSSLSTAS